MYSTILVPLDGSDLANQAIPHACELAGPETDIVLLGVSTVFQAKPMEMDQVRVVDPDLKAVEAYLADAARGLEAQGIRVTTETRVGNAAEKILDFAEEAGVDLIVLTSHGRTGLARWYFGSVSEKVVRHAHCAVMVVRESTSRE